MSTSLEMADSRQVESLLADASELGRMLNGIRGKLETKLAASSLAPGP
ncbi:hypothetical protein [Solilutibacter pythonis]|nr:hypothetical protein [Lysobacter pythonis]